MSEHNAQNLSALKSEKVKKGILKKIPRIYFVAVAVVFVICCLYALFQMTNSRSMIININSASVAAGKNPDGTSFDIYAIFSDAVLEAASQRLGGKISAEEIKSHLSISDALTAETNQQLKQSILNGEKENTYFPTVYRLTYSLVSDALCEKGGIRMFSAYFKELFAFRNIDQILETVVDCYREFYEYSFLTYDSMFEINWTKIDTMDYYNRSEALRTEAMRILRFLQDKEKENSAEGASNEKLTFGDLSNGLWQLISEDIQNHQAYIIQNSITSAREDILRQFRYMEEIHIEEMERQTERYLILDEAVDLYDSTTTKVVFIPALDQDNSFYMNRTKVGLDYLVESADAAKLAADEAEHQAKHYQYLQECFDKTVAPKKDQIEHTDAIYSGIKAELNELMDSVKMLLAERNHSENEGIKSGNPNMTVGIIGVGMSFAKRFVILSMAAYVVICVFTFLPKKKKNVEAQEV